MGEAGATTGAVPQWAKALDGLGEVIGGRFTRAGPRRRVGTYLRGLLSPIARKNRGQVAEGGGDATPYGVPHLVGRARGDADEVRDDLRA
jgi:SRSO17 transposase